MKKFLKSRSPRILISRINNIGDVIVTMAMAGLLKKYYPGCYVIVLARDYARAVIEAHPSVDEFLSWNILAPLPPEDAIKSLKNLKLDVFIHSSPIETIAKLAAKAKIPYRIGSLRRSFHYFTCNRRVLWWKGGNLHEAQINLKLLAPFGIKEKLTLEQLQPLTKLTPPPTPLPEDIAAAIDPKRFNLIVHPLSNNHGREWPLERYIQLINSLPDTQFNIFITGMAHEAISLTPLTSQCPKAHAICGKLDLAQLLSLMQRCDGLIASSTGPLHMAAVLGKKALGIYPPASNISATQWGPIGPQAEYLVGTTSKPKCTKKCLHFERRSCLCVQAITVAEIRAVLERWLLP